MKMNTDNAWILNKATQEDGCFVSVGGLAEALEQEGCSSGSVIPMRHAFVRLIQLGRREQRLSLDQLAGKIDVDLKELLRIETEEHYRPAILTVHKLAGFLKVPEKQLMALAGLL